MARSSSAGKVLLARRRRFPRPDRLLVVVLVLSGVLAGVSAPGRMPGAAATPSVSPAAAGEPLNVVLVVTDDQTLESVSKMPYVSGRTDWVDFTNTFTNVGLCCPARASLLTGLYSHHHGVESNLEAQAFDDSSTLATWLSDAGYRTALVGKYLNQYPWNRPPDYVPPGWSEWYAFRKNLSATEGFYYNYTLNQNGSLVSYGAAPEDYSTDVLAAQAVDFIDRADGPFFLQFSPSASHAPRTPAPRHAGAFAGEPVTQAPSFNEADVSDKPAWVQGLPLVNQALMEGQRRNAWETGLAVDEAVEDIFVALEANGALDNTVVIFTTDNGYSYAEHRWQRKKCAYDECVRVPLLVRQPGRAAESIPALISNVDIAPTIAELAGIQPPTLVDGVSFVPLLEGTVPIEAGVHRWRTTLLLHWIGDADLPGFWGVRTASYKYIELDTGERELYDVAGDPYELENLAGTAEVAEIEANLADQLANLKAEGLDPHGPAALPAPGEGALFGAHVEVDPAYTGPDRPSAVAAFESLIGRPIALERVFYRWDEPWPTAQDTVSAAAGRTLVISWNAGRLDDSLVRWADIAAGLHDPEIDAQAVAVKDFGRPFVFVFHHEPANGGPAGIAGTPDEFRAAFRHVRARFEAAGVTNVTYGLILFAWNFRTGDAIDFYPGDDVVDLVASDGYNWYLCNGFGGSPWISWTEVFAPMFWFGREHNKPMLIAEWASGEDPAAPERKADWITEGREGMKRWPQILGLGWFHTDRNLGCPRWVDSSPESLAAFQAMGADPYFRPTNGPLVVTISSGPEPATTATAAAFEFAANDPGAALTCSLDGTASVPCTSPATYEDLGPGGHTFTVEASTGIQVASVTAGWTVAPVSTMVTAADFAFTPRRPVVPTGTAVRWTVAGPSSHTVTDSTGLMLFDSGPLAMGETFDRVFTAAGSYAYRCSLHPTQMNGTITVPLGVNPSSGTISTTFAVTYASGPGPAGLTQEVQVKRPGSATWSNAIPAATGSSFDFVPDGGPGTYSFRARLRNTLTAVASGWSPTVSITVT